MSDPVILTRELPIEPHICELVATLRDAGYETYIVGGALRDHLLGRVPKDYDISTAARPEQIREVFGRRRARIIGKRFQLVHVTHGGELIEVSTFRRAPSSTHGRRKNDDLPENLIVSDNDFGTPEEDVWRRDFTINALFYDPCVGRLIDFTGMGLADIEGHVVRAIGDPGLRFEEDPVRMLRALKLVAQYDFSMDPKTENALFASLELIHHASPSRLSLELEKILSSTYGDRHFRTFHDYGFLRYFLPEFDARWNSETVKYAVDLLAVRNERVAAGIYRNSVSLAMAVLALPFIEELCGSSTGGLWSHDRHAMDRIGHVLSTIFKPQTMINRMTDSSENMLQLQPGLFAGDTELRNASSYSHARELLMIQNDCFWHRDDLEGLWPPGRGRNRESSRQRRDFAGNGDAGGAPKRRRRRGHGRSGKRPEAPADFNPEA